MKQAKIKLTLILLCTFLIGCSFILDIISMIRPAELAAHAEGTPTIAVRKTELLCTGISQVVADDDRIYVLFGDYSVVQVYTTDGQYLYSVSVYNHSNGRTHIAAKDGCLYIQDKHDNIYVFSDGVFSKYLDKQEAASLEKTLNFDASDPDYTTKKGSLWRVSDSRCVLKRPDWLIVYQGSLNWRIKIFLAILIGYLLYFPKPKKQQERKT